MTRILIVEVLDLLSHTLPLRKLSSIRLKGTYVSWYLSYQTATSLYVKFLVFFRHPFLNFFSVFFKALYLVVGLQCLY